MAEVKTETGPWAMVPLWVITRASANGVKLYALLAAKWADRETGSCFPSKRTVGQALGVSESTVERAIKELVEIGALKVDARNRADGSPTSNLYTLIQVAPGPVRPPATPARPMADPLTETSINNHTDCDPSDREASPPPTRPASAEPRERELAHLVMLASKMGVDDPDLLVAHSPWTSDPRGAATEMVRAWKSCRIEDKRGWCAEFLRRGPKNGLDRSSASSKPEGPTGGSDDSGQLETVGCHDDIVGQGAGAPGTVAPDLPQDIAVAVVGRKEAEAVLDEEHVEGPHQPGHNGQESHRSAQPTRRLATRTLHVADDSLLALGSLGERLGVRVIGIESECCAGAFLDDIPVA